MAKVTLEAGVPALGAAPAMVRVGQADLSTAASHVAVHLDAGHAPEVNIEVHALHGVDAELLDADVTITVSDGFALGVLTDCRDALKALADGIMTGELKGLDTELGQAEDALARASVFRKGN